MNRWKSRLRGLTGTWVLNGSVRCRKQNAVSPKTSKISTHTHPARFSRYTSTTRRVGECTCSLRRANRPSATLRRQASTFHWSRQAEHVGKGVMYFGRAMYGLSIARSTNSNPAKSHDQDGGRSECVYALPHCDEKQRKRHETMLSKGTVRHQLVTLVRALNLA